MINPNITIR